MTDASLSDPNTLLAKRLREARTARGLSLQAAAELTGVSRSMLSQIERAGSSPTLSTVWNLARAFDLDMAQLVGAETRSAIALRRAAELPEIVDAERGARLRILSAPEQAGRLELYDIALRPGARLDSAPHWPGCREHVTVIEGALDLRSGEDRAALRQGDAAEYAADVDHALAAGEAGARVMLVVSGGDGA